MFKEYSVEVNHQLLRYWGIGPAQTAVSYGTAIAKLSLSLLSTNLFPFIVKFLGQIHTKYYPAFFHVHQYLLRIFSVHLVIFKQILITYLEFSKYLKYPEFNTKVHQPFIGCNSAYGSLLPDVLYNNFVVFVLLLRKFGQLKMFLNEIYTEARISKYTGCPRRKGQNFGRVFLMLNYTDVTQNTYIQSWTVTEIMTREVWNFDSCYTLIDYQIHIKTGRNMWFL